MLKKYLMLFLVLFLAFNAEAQKKYTRKIQIETTDDEDDDDDDDSDDEGEVVAEEEDDVVISTKPMGKYLYGNSSDEGVKFEPMVFLGWNGLSLKSYDPGMLGGSTSFSQLGMKGFTSWNVGLFPLGIQANLAAEKFFLVTGLGVQFFNYKFADSVYFNTSAPYYIEKGNSNSIIKTKFGTSYLSLPLLFKYKTRNRAGQNNFTFGLGMIGGYRLKSWTKMKDDNGSKFKSKSGADFNVRDFMYAPVVLIGFKQVNIFASFNLSPLHANNGSGSGNINAYPWTFGLQL